MPNWVKAKLTIEGKDASKAMKSLLVKNGEDGYRFDFNKILPMPEELNIVSGSTTDKCVEIYLASLNPKVKDFGAENKDEKLFYQLRDSANKGKAFGRYDGELSKQEIDEFVEKHKGDEKLNTFEDFINYGKKAIDNTLKFGSMDWYDWCVKHWGTKWKACHTEHEENIPNEVIFDTAWSDVRGLIYQLSKMYPSNTFIYEYAEEQIGLYAGTITIENGNVLEDIEFESGSKEAFEKAFELWGEDLKNIFKFNEKTNTYEYHENNEGEMD